MASQTAVQFKALLGCACTQSGHNDTVLTSTENVTSQPNVDRDDREWHPWTADLEKTGLASPIWLVVRKLHGSSEI